MKSPTPLNAAELRRHPLPPPAEGDKYAHGRLLVVAGTRDIAGSALITATAGMRTGVGKVTIVTVDSAAPGLRMAVPEAMVIGVAEAREGGLARSTVGKIATLAQDYEAVVAGPGMKPTAVTKLLARALCKTGKKVVFDAALLHDLTLKMDKARGADVTPILLPNSGEMAALLGCSEEKAAADPLGCGCKAAQRYGSIVLAKGVESHIVAPDGAAWKYEGGGPGLGMSGSGDALAGILGGLLARGADPLAALLWAVWLHGEAGRSLSKKIGPVGFLAREISSEVPVLMAKFQPSLE